MIPKTVKLSTDGLDFLTSCLKYSPYERLNWTMLEKHPYLQSSEYNFVDNHQNDNLDKFLHLSVLDAKNFTHA